VSYKDALPMPDIDLLREKFELDADRGVLIRRQTYHGFKSGEVVGYLRPCGYRWVKLKARSINGLHGTLSASGTGDGCG